MIKLKIGKNLKTKQDVENLICNLIIDSHQFEKFVLIRHVINYCQGSPLNLSDEEIKNYVEKILNYLLQKELVYKKHDVYYSKRDYYIYQHKTQPNPLKDLYKNLESSKNILSSC